jgi:hypothetical protein
MAFIDDATDTGRPTHAANSLPRQYYTLAALGTSVLIWTIMIAVVLSQL